MFSPENIEEFMKEAIDLAWRHDEGIYRPYVGALVLSNEGEILARGTKKFLPGTNSLYVHAERDALSKAVGRVRGAILLTTLEPCVRHPFKRSILSPCVELIVEEGLSHVIIGRIDTADSVDGRGINYLRNKGILVELYHGAQREELERLFRVRRSPRDSSDRYINPSLDVK